MLVRAKLPNLEEIPGCSGCGSSRCQVCGYIENATTFTDKDGSHTFEIRKGPLNGNSKFVVYLLQCKVCKKQNCGSTETAYRYRFNNYKSKFKKYKEMYIDGKLQKDKIIQQASFHDHFCQNDHSGTSDWSVKLIDQADDLTSLRKKESFWQHKLKTFVPNGLNEREVSIA